MARGSRPKAQYGRRFCGSTVEAAWKLRDRQLQEPEGRAVQRGPRGPGPAPPPQFTAAPRNPRGALGVGPRKLPFTPQWFSCAPKSERISCGKVRILWTVLRPSPPLSRFQPNRPCAQLAPTRGRLPCVLVNARVQRQPLLVR